MEINKYLRHEICVSYTYNCNFHHTENTLLSHYREKIIGVIQCRSTIPYPNSETRKSLKTGSVDGIYLSHY